MSIHIHNQRIWLIFILVAFASVLMGKKCDNTRKQLHRWNIKAGKALVEVEETWDTYYKTEADRIGDELLAANADNPNWTEEMATEAFKKALTPLDFHDRRFSKALSSSASALEALEHTLETWEHAGEGNAAQAAADVIAAFSDLTEVLVAAGVEVPEDIFKCIDGLRGILEALSGK